VLTSCAAPSRESVKKSNKQQTVAVEVKEEKAGQQRLKAHCKILERLRERGGDIQQ